MLKFFRKIHQKPLSENKFSHKLTIRFILIAALCLFWSCNTANKKSKLSKTHLNTKEVSEEILSANEQWMNAINTKDLETLKELYVEDIYGLSPNGIDFSDRDTLISILSNNNFTVKDVNTIKRIKANGKYDYEIGSFKNKSGGLVKYLIIWDTSEEEEKHVLEFLAEADDFSVDLKWIDSQRDEWMRLCNDHNAENLINTLYSKNTLYYNHKPMVVGRENLIPNYAYMNNSNYELSLSPLIVETVSKTIVYEIGQCEGSYNGKYILIWQKTDDEWQILFDSNI
ncbi:hypothetical protein MTsPCn9_15460 [Croceitalea sp. MTPC9]|uniref:nuclear transport factor 2 family protein n=1 Tax=unclassified Croceitalea TaxID=2632280 RepID=UPI002B37F25C|nr:hypothetical protein MTsPCn6_13670 [Croceitalea sp. MTPC6]GMN16610.1 hypothetical protein MTsPCn9_15460 [Croceitalea sp. MTPC9]